MTHAEGPEEQKPAITAPQNSAITTNKITLSSLLEWSKPYREIGAILATTVGLMSASIAWIVAHFATQAELHYLECRITNSILTQLLPFRMEEFAGKLEWRTSQIKLLAQRGTKNADDTNAITDLVEQVNSLSKAQKDAIEQFQKKIDNIAKSCVSGTPGIGKTIDD
ncbi:hypothetical protein [Methylocella sp.]|uniref:hypothetical protein n=1 Tax=Methylocella sp. TaxID=1978226 RepID=UPI0035B1EF7E